MGIVNGPQKVTLSCILWTVATRAVISGKEGSGSAVQWKGDKIKGPETEIGLITRAE